jgi:hypothetical protein
MVKGTTISEILADALDKIERLQLQGDCAGLEQQIAYVKRAMVYLVFVLDSGLTGEHLQMISDGLPKTPHFWAYKEQQGDLIKELFIRSSKQEGYVCAREERHKLLIVELQKAGFYLNLDNSIATRGSERRNLGLSEMVANFLARDVSDIADIVKECCIRNES